MITKVEWQVRGTCFRLVGGGPPRLGSTFQPSPGTPSVFYRNTTSRQATLTILATTILYHKQTFLIRRGITTRYKKKILQQLYEIYIQEENFTPSLRSLYKKKIYNIYTKSTKSIHEENLQHLYEIYTRRKFYTISMKYIQEETLQHLYEICNRRSRIFTRRSLFYRKTL